jgi:hypothetical protein
VDLKSTFIKNNYIFKVFGDTKMMPPFFFRPTFLVELIYSIAVIISCLIIYFKTREMYNITSYRGIKYFSKAFLFFAVAYFFRFIFGILFRLFIDLSSLLPPKHGGQFGQIGMIIYIYASTMAALYAFYSVIWKKVENDKTNNSLIMHLIAIIITLLTVFLFGPLLHVGIQFVLFLGAAIIGIIDLNKSEKKHQKGLYFVYTLILLSWIFNILAVELPGFLFEIKLVLYIISLALFSIILWRVLKVTGHKK